MTAQVTEKLIIDGKQLAMCSEPLGILLMQNMGPKFMAQSSACWRGYVGTWELKQDSDEKKRLYLISINGLLESGENATLEKLFPDNPEGVFAHWFSGTIRCPDGKLLNYVHGGYASTYERDYLYEFDKGVLISESIVENGHSDNPDASEGYQVAAFTTFARDE
jgi:hypothetical protein